ncbi:MAG: DUF255 domain-containing protein [Gammaproteobacteria bacterium]
MNRYKILLLSCIILLFSQPLICADNSATNQLAGHYSPYLAMHGHDPVDWMPWGEEALTKARKQNKLIFISSGYYACHWCHVMHRESYSSQDVANIINANYIAIKVDREINPVLDKRLINFVQITTGSAGWPLNVILTPDGYPLVGATYIPKQQLQTSLQRIATQWKKNASDLQGEAKSMHERHATLIRRSDNKGQKKHIADNQAAFVQQTMQLANTLQGGFSEAQQFPSTPQLLALLRLKKRPQAVNDFLQLTLDNMQNRGLHDVIGGGFFRYTMEPGWTRPHYEKMLYTNALLPLIYLEASHQFANSQYQKTALETLTFLQNEMQGADGGFIASLSAVDDKGVEGGYYLWSGEALKKILDKEDFHLLSLAWNISEDTAEHLPMLQMTLDMLADKLKQDKNVLRNRLQEINQTLREYRQKHREIPRDTKQLAGWNGLVLAAFARLSVIDPSLKPAGRKLATFLSSLWEGKQLRRAAASGAAGTLNDYAAVGWGLLQWGQVEKDKVAIKTAEALIQTAWTSFYTEKGWRENEHELLPDPVYRQHIEDSSLPASEALLVDASLMADNPAFHRLASQLLAKSTLEVEEAPYSYASLISVAQKLER